ncbi:MAG: exodeoxyribonuclease VII small subunit [Alphaproteobacteria bacterium]|nr:exodeoxyribonuclease VII small subunit [Alphaproteobacteria bacterium]
MSKASTTTDLSFEQAMGNLETIVKDLESGKTDLESAITAYEKGMELKNFCEAKLRDAQMKVEKITLAGGKAKTEDFKE